MSNLKQIFFYGALFCSSIVSGQDLITNSGKVYVDYSIVKVTASGIKIVHEQGVKLIPFNELPHELRVKIADKEREAIETHQNELKSKKDLQLLTAAVVTLCKQSDELVIVVEHITENTVIAGLYFQEVPGMTADLPDRTITHGEGITGNAETPSPLDGEMPVNPDNLVKQGKSFVLLNLDTPDLHEKDIIDFNNIIYDENGNEIDRSFNCYFLGAEKVESSLIGFYTLDAALALRTLQEKEAKEQAQSTDNP